MDGDVALKPQWTPTFWRRAPSDRHTHVMLDYDFLDSSLCTVLFSTLEEK